MDFEPAIFVGELPAASAHAVPPICSYVAEFVSMLFAAGYSVEVEFASQLACCS